jgi:hypothetical protein
LFFREYAAFGLGMLGVPACWYVKKIAPSRVVFDASDPATFKRKNTMFKIRAGRLYKVPGDEMLRKWVAGKLF